MKVGKVVLCVVLSLLHSGAVAVPSAQAQDWPQISLGHPISGFNFPVHITHAGDDRIFVAEVGGLIRVVENGALLSTPFLDISTLQRQGLFSVAFAPDYATSGYFYVNYVDQGLNVVIARYQAAGNPTTSNVADPNSARIILRLASPHAGTPYFTAGHAGGELGFSPIDGYLYVGIGDGDEGNRDTEEVQEGDSLNLAQNPGDLHGKMLRLDVSGSSDDFPNDPDRNYGIPATNPFRNTAGYLPEIWALGVRNPWRSSFDRQTGDYYIGDVGQDTWEEIDFQPATSTGGENYGWKTMEGSNCYSPRVGCDPTGLTPPVWEYPHDAQQLGSVTGGRVYRGTSYARMQGVYFYGDYNFGDIWGLRKVSGVWQSTLLKPDAIPAYGTYSFGEDADGNIWITNANSGTIYKIVDSNPAPTNVSLAPNSGSSAAGAVRAFGAVYSDANGATDIRSAYLLANSSVSGVNGLMCYYDAVANRLYLRNNAGNGWLGGFAPGTANVISNSQGSLHCATTTVSRAGSKLTIGWRLTPKAAFAGTRNLFLYVQDTVGQTDGWDNLGTWSITSNAAPSNVSLAPSSGSSAAGAVRAFGTVYSDANGATDIRSAYLLANSSVSGVNGLMCYYDAVANRLYLRNNAGNGWLGGFAPGTANVISNSQGSLHCATTTVSRAGSKLTIGWRLTPTAAFAGTRNLFLYVQDTVGQTDGWDNLGTWTITGNLPPSSVSLSPNSGSSPPGTPRLFTAVYSDPNSAADINLSYLRVGGSNANGLLCYYNPVVNKLYLRNDAGNGWLGGFAPGSANTITNSQGRLNCNSTSVIKSGNTLTVYWCLTPVSTFAGTRSLFLYVRDVAGLTDGYDNLGRWTHTATPVISSFTPTNGPVGTIVTINGSNFTGTAAVKFNGLTAGAQVSDITTAGAGYQIVSASQVKARVPTGAVTGKISITNGAGDTGTSANSFIVAGTIAAPYAQQYAAFAVQATLNVEADLAAMTSIAEIIADRHIQGGMIGTVFRGQSLEEEVTGRSGGLMHMGFDRPWSQNRTSEMNAYNVAFIGWERGPAPGDLSTLQTLHDAGTYIVGFGPRSRPDLAAHVALCDAFFDTGLGTDDRVVTLPGGGKAGQANLLVNMLNAWALTGEIVASLTRRGKMPTMWKSWMYPDGPAWSDIYYGKVQFHNDYTVAPIAAETISRAYLQNIRASIQAFANAEGGGMAQAARMIAAEKAAGRMTIVATQGHTLFRYVGLYEDAQWATLYDFDGTVQAHIDTYRTSPDNALVLRMGYHGLSQIEAPVFAEKNQRVILVSTATPRFEFQPPPGLPLTIDNHWQYGDAVVAIAGYPLKLLPPSGIMQMVAYESINVEVLARL